MDQQKIQDLITKHTISHTDLFVIEDEDGTKTIKFDTIKNNIQQSMVCRTVNELKNINLPEGSIVRTLGYYKANDGGAATYVIENDPTSVDNGSTCIFLKSSDTLRAKLINTGNISIAAFGAVGNGIVDDYKSIQNAINSGYVLFFPNKTYKITSPLNIPSNYNINFCGCTIICSNSTAISLGTSDEYVSNIKIQNLNIIGMKGILINNQKSHNITLDTISFVGETNLSGNGFEIHTNNNIKILNCDIRTKSGFGIYIYDNWSDQYKLSNVSYIKNCKVVSDSIALHVSVSCTVYDVLYVQNCIFDSFYSLESKELSVSSISVLGNINCDICNCTVANSKLSISAGANVVIHIKDIVSQGCKQIVSITSSTATAVIDGYIHNSRQFGTGPIYGDMLGSIHDTSIKI